MNILIVDDQISVLNGIKCGVHFKELGLDEMYFATNSIMAREILTEHNIHIMLCDIEMPGENGLELNHFVREKYPRIIRILLTSHAKFSYAQESLKLGCFDYLLQPAPYDEIEQCLHRAIGKYHLDDEHRAVFEKGRLFEELKPEMSDRIILNLFSQNIETSNESRHMLERMGYPIGKNSMIRIMMLDVYSYVSATDSKYGDITIRKNFETCIEQTGLNHDSIFTLLTMNRFRRYVMLLFSNDNALESVRDGWYQNLYDNIMLSFGTGLALYISNYDSYLNMHVQINVVENILSNNVNLVTGIYFAKSDKPAREITSPDMQENISRWKRMFENQDFDIMKKSVSSYLDFITSAHIVNFKSLCDLHQQITQLFYNYMYNNSIELSDLFDESYSYRELLDAYQNIEALRKAVCFMADALNKISHSDSSDNDIENAKTYILNNFNRDITVKEVADHVHRSPEYFTKIFKNVTGQNIKSYIMQVKLNVAKDMLANPNILISMISCEIGYTNFSHFTQMFKKYEDMTPTEYRKAKLDGKGIPVHDPKIDEE